MKSLVVIIYILALAGCPQKSSHTATRSRKPVTARSTNSTPRLVDAQWIEVYRRMEHDHGNYKIKDDEKIVPVGDKFRVPPSVVRNFLDLSNAER
jgi:hypothetical protein